jgi:hypothetical protein
VIASVAAIHLAERDPFRNQVIQVHLALQVQFGVHRNIALEVGRAVVDSLDALLPTDRVKDVHTHLDFGPRHADKVQSTTDAEHCQPLLAHGLEPYEVEDVISSSRQ